MATTTMAPLASLAHHLRMHAHPHRHRRRRGPSRPRSAFTSTKRGGSIFPTTVEVGTYCHGMNFRPSAATATCAPHREVTRRRRSSVARSQASATSSEFHSSARFPAHRVEPSTYEEHLAAKASAIRTLFGEDGSYLPHDRDDGLEVYPSPKTRGYRLRCRFAVVHDEDAGAVRYALFENGRVRVLDVGGGEDEDDDADDAVVRVDDEVRDDSLRGSANKKEKKPDDQKTTRTKGGTSSTSFPAASDAIAALMPRLLRRLNRRDDVDDTWRRADDEDAARREKEIRGAKLLVEGLSAVGFLASRGGDVVVTLWNSGGGSRIKTSGGHVSASGSTSSSGGGGGGGEDADVDDDEDWDAAANALVRELGVKGVVGRSKGLVRVASGGVDHLWETVTVRGAWNEEDGTRAGFEATVAAATPSSSSSSSPSSSSRSSSSSAADGITSSRVLRYQQVEGVFSNPNGDVAEVTANWLYSTVGEIRRLRCGGGGGGGDGRSFEAQGAPGSSSPLLLPSLVELYCGNGNHTCCLSPHFCRVTAVEIEPRLVAAAYENFRVNGVENALCRALPAVRFLNPPFCFDDPV